MLATSAAEAAARARDCQRRVDDLRRGSVVIGDADVARARDHLARAKDRAATARRRLDEVRRHHEGRELMRRLGSAARAGERLPVDGDAGAAAPTRLKALEWVSRGELGLKPFWLAFVSLGGQCGVLEFDAYVHGAWQMSDRDLSVLDQLCWEYETFGTI